MGSQFGLTYNARDWADSDTYNSNGNTQVGRTALAEPPGTDTYDFQNRLILRRKSDGSSINLAYDADGNRIQKTILNAASAPVSSTTYLVDTNNLTGYAQVVEERTAVTAGTTLKVYTYGSDLLSQTKTPISDATVTSYYAYDGLASVRFLTNGAGTITDAYDYDAFGNLVTRIGSTENAYLYRGEQFDADLGLYYNRARYLNQNSGRFWIADSYEGRNGDPAALHKFLYANGDPITFIDPSGNFSVAGVSISQAISNTLDRMSNLRVVKIVKGLYGAKFADINWVQNGLHSSIFVGFKDSAVGMTYEVVTNYRPVFPKSFLPPFLDVVFGTFRIEPSIPNGKKTKIASLSRNQFAAWNVMVIPLGFSAEHGAASVLYSVPGWPGTVNCLSWTAEAAAAALLFRLIPMGG